MFEVVLSVCLSVSEGPCRDQLVPGLEAETRAACEAQLHRAPDGARCAPLGEVLELMEVAPGVFVHKGQIAEASAENGGDVSNLGFVIGEASVAVIDTGTARWIGEALWRAIRAQTDKPVDHVILTHMHPDHVLGATVLREAGATVWSHARMPRALSDRQENYLESLSRLIGPAFIGTAVSEVDRTVETIVEIDLGARVLEVEAWPTAHTGNDLTVLDTETGTLFAGDLVFHQHTPALDGSLRGWQSVLAELADRNVARVVPGHGDHALAWPEGAAAQARYLAVLAEDTRAAIAEGKRLGEAVEEIAQEEAEAWDLFHIHNPRNATVSFTELEWE